MKVKKRSLLNLYLPHVRSRRRLLSKLAIGRQLLPRGLRILFHLFSLSSSNETYWVVFQVLKLNQVDTQSGGSARVCSSPALHIIASEGFIAVQRTKLKTSTIKNLLPSIMSHVHVLAA